MRMHESVSSLVQPDENEVINKYFDSQWMQIQMFLDGFDRKITLQSFENFFEGFVTTMRLKVENLADKLSDISSVLEKQLFRDMLGCESVSNIPKNVYFFKAFIKIAARYLDIQFSVYDKFKPRRSSLNMEVTNSLIRDAKSFENVKVDPSNDKNESENQYEEEEGEQKPMLDKISSMNESTQIPEINLKHLAHFLHYDNLHRMEVDEEKSTPQLISEEQQYNETVPQSLLETVEPKNHELGHQHGSHSKIIKAPKKKPLTPEEQIERNLHKLYSHYARMQTWKQKLDKDFESYETNLNSMKLSEFLYFCDDFAMELSSDKIVNREELSTIFKLVATSTLGITFEKFVNILRHIAKIVNEERENQLFQQLTSHCKASPETKSDDQNDHSKLSRERKMADDKIQNSEQNLQVIVGDLEREMMGDENQSIKDNQGLNSSEHKLPLQDLAYNKNFEEQMKEEGTVSKTNLFENENPQSTIRSPHQEESLKLPANPRAYSRSRVAHKCKPINLHMSKSELDSQFNDVYIQYLRSKGVHSWETCKCKMRKPKGFVNIIERNNLARILEKKFKENEAREKRCREQIQATHKSLFVGSVNCSSEHEKSAFNRLYDLSKSMHRHFVNHNHPDKIELKPLKKIPKRKKTLIKFDSYCAREQHKIQANFLQHISWEIISKMNSHDLAAQINGKLMAEKVKIKGVGKQSKENPLSNEINGFANGLNEKVTQVKIKKILNYGKLQKQK